MIFEFFEIFYIITYFCGKCVNIYENKGATEATPAYKNNGKKLLHSCRCLLFYLVSKRYQKSVSSAENPWYIRFFRLSFCYCKIFLACLGAIFFILPSLSIPPHFLSKKKKKRKRRSLKKKKRKKKKRKKESLFISIFLPISLSRKKIKKKR